MYAWPQRPTGGGPGPLPSLPCSLAAHTDKVSPNMASPKTSWPECVGKTGEEAQALILGERPELQVQIMMENQPATMDYRPDRVRIILDKDSKIVKMQPVTG